MDLTGRCAASMLCMIVGDAMAVPAHLYINKAAIVRDTGGALFADPPCQHPEDPMVSQRLPDRDHWRADISPLARPFVGQRGAHQHRLLSRGENSATVSSVKAMLKRIIAVDSWELDDLYAEYCSHMVSGSQKDFHVYDHHIEFFENYADGLKPRYCGSEKLSATRPASVILMAAPVLLLCCKDSEATNSIVRRFVRQLVPSAELEEFAIYLRDFFWHIQRGDDMEEEFSSFCDRVAFGVKGLENFDDAEVLTRFLFF